MRRRRTLEIALAIAALLSSGATASAQATDPATRKAARILADEGLALFDRGDHAAALEKLNKADSLVSAPTVDLFAARCLVRLGRLVEASARYGEVIDATLDESAPDAFKDAVNDARKERDALLPRVPSILVTVENGGETFTVRVDGAEIAQERLRGKLPVDPGTHAIEARRGDQTVAQQVSVREGDSATVTLKLPAPKPAPKPAPVTIAPDDTGATQRTLGWITLGIGAVGLGVWGVTGALALGQEGDLSDRGCSAGSCPHGVDPGSYDGLRTVSTIGFWAGIVGLGAGAALLLSAPSATPRVAAWAGASPSGGAAGMRGAF